MKSIRYVRVAAALAAMALTGLGAPATAQGQQAAPPGGTLTLLALPHGSRIAITGTSRLSGPSPLELPAGWSGRQSVSLAAPGYAWGQSVIAVPTEGTPYSLSEAPGMSAGLLVRSLNLPGLPSYSSGHKVRGVALIAAVVGAGYGAAHAQVQHNRDIDLASVKGDDKADDQRVYRNRWLAYGGAVWGISALDYVVRSRVRILQATRQTVTLGVPKLTRGGMLWRSLLVPGGGQEFAGQRGRGLLWLGASLATGAAYVIAQGNVDERRTEVRWARTLLDSAGPSERALRLDELERRQGSLANARDLRDGFRTAIVAIYAANVLDTLIAPIRRDDGPGTPRVSLDAPLDPRRAALALSYRF